jgi:ZIP family zinc transporter
MTTAILAAKRFLETRFELKSERPHVGLAKLTVLSLAIVASVYLLARGTEVLLVSLASSAAFRMGAVGSLAAGLVTAVGALPVLFLRAIKTRTEDMLLGFGAGVMLAASCFSLILPGMDAAMAQAGSKGVAAAIVAVGIAIGALFLTLCDRLLPHEHFIKGHEGLDSQKVRGIWLFVIAITLHNFPEGLAVGVGFGGGDFANGMAIATGIGLQNAPEGLVVAFALLTLRYTRWYAWLVALGTGLIEPVGGLIGAGVVSIAQSVLPWAMGFAAGAMIFVVSHEIIPESHRKGHEMPATLGVLLGFVVMMMLDTTLG